MYFTLLLYMLLNIKIIKCWVIVQALTMLTYFHKFIEYLPFDHVHHTFYNRQTLNYMDNFES